MTIRLGIFFALVKSSLCSRGRASWLRPIYGRDLGFLIAGLTLVSGCQSVNSKVWIYREYPSCDASLRLVIEGQELAKFDWTGPTEPKMLTARQKHS